MFDHMRKVDNVEAFRLEVGILHLPNEHRKGTLCLRKSSGRFADLHAGDIPPLASQVRDEPAGRASDIEKSSWTTEGLGERREINVFQTFAHELEELFLVCAFIGEILLGIASLEVVEYRLRVLVDVPTAPACNKSVG